jgi:phosphatidylserine/phosphatidylglycerophosphate/cardiolipin synthase-like enzyme
MGDPIVDALNDAPPAALTQRNALAPQNQLATFRFPGDRHRPESGRWFADGPDAHTVHHGNEVMYLVDGKDTYAEMAKAIRAAVDPAHDFIYILGWTLFLDFPFAEDGATLFELLRDASARGIQVRIMIWCLKVPPSVVFPVPEPKIQIARRLNDLKNVRVILDERVLQVGAGSHHQKMVVVNTQSGLIGFCGGIDINPDRVFAKDVQGAGQNGGPMHDVHCRIRGPATYDLLQTFIDRWSDYIDAYALLDSPPLLARTTAPSDQPRRGAMQVQIGRTYGNGTAHAMVTNVVTNLPQRPYRFARTGETSARAMFLHAIRGARRFIYIEDQYLVNPEASAALVEAAKNVAHITILIPHSDISDMPRVWELRKRFITPLRNAGGEKVQIFVRYPYGTYVPHSYVHAKTWIFDDEYAIIGSPNVNRRSWTHDSELCAGVYDTSSDEGAAYTFAHRLRIRLWAEHLNMSTPHGMARLADGVAAAMHWQLQGTNVRAYDENSGKDGPVAARAPLDVVDPDGS